ncbi:MAG: hypothetical protein ACFFCW_37865 [Candidatus Hodarchaeota archaeon]
MQRKKVGMSLFVVGVVLLGLTTWGALLWYSFGIPIAYPFGILEYPAIPEVDPFNPPPHLLPLDLVFWGGLHLYLWFCIPLAAAMLMLIGGLIMAQIQKEVS